MVKRPIKPIKAQEAEVMAMWKELKRKGVTVAVNNEIVRINVGITRRENQLKERKEAMAKIQQEIFWSKSCKSKR